MFIDNLILFAQNNLLLLIVVLVIIVIVISILKTVVKWIITLLILAGLAYFVATYELPAKTLGELLIQENVGTPEEELITKFVHQGTSASYKITGNGNFIIAAGGITASGTKEGSHIKINHLAESIEVEKTPVMKAYIAMLKAKNYPTKAQ